MLLPVTQQKNALGAPGRRNDYCLSPIEIIDIEYVLLSFLSQNFLYTKWANFLKLKWAFFVSALVVTKRRIYIRLRCSIRNIACFQMTTKALQITRSWLNSNGGYVRADI